MRLDPDRLLAGRPLGGRLWLALSGGLDSTVLLHLLARSAAAEMSAIHIHHGLQPAADGWTEHCRRLCAGLGVPLRIEHVVIDPADPAGPEAAARAARRAAWQRALRPGDVLALAHHRDDQAETLLLRLLRGTGLAGLAAMRPVEDFGELRLWRPLLDLPRGELRAYAGQHGLDWVEDPHNADPRYARSWLRTTILPALRARWPGADQALARTAAQAGETRALLDALAAIDLRALRLDDAAASLSASALRALEAPRRRNALHAWLAQAGIAVPSAALLARIDEELLAAAPDRQPRLAIGGFELVRYRDALRLQSPLAPPPPAGQRWLWSDADCVLPSGCGRLSASSAPPFALSVGFPSGGERLRPAASSRTRSLKNLFQEAGVPPAQRARTPLLFRGERLVAVADRWRDPEFAQACASACWDYVWTRPQGFV